MGADLAVRQGWPAMTNRSTFGEVFSRGEEKGKGKEVGFR